MKKTYQILVLVSLVYLVWYVGASVTGDNSLLWKIMDIFGAGVVTIGMGLFALVLIALSLGNIAWIPALAREKKIGALVLHIVGAIIAVILVISGVLALLG